MSVINSIEINGVVYDLPSGGSGTSDYSQLTNKPQINGNELSGNKTSSQLGLASASDIPTKVSDLDNDSGFITGLTVLTYNSSTWNDFITAFNANKVVFVRCGAGTTPGASTKPILAHLVKVDYYNGNPRYAEFRFDDYVDTKTYANQDDHIRIYKLFTDNGWTLTTVPVAPKIEAGNDLTYTWTESGRERTLTISLDNTLNDLTNYYTKSNTYTKTEVDNLIGAISTISFEIVQTLPTTNIKTNIIYLVPKSPSGTQNTYTEYINTTGTTSGWEKIGDTEIDLSNYYTKTESDARYLQSFTETDPTVPAWAKASTKPTYTKSEVGLGNVPNVSTNDQQPTFTQASSRTNIASGEKLSTIFGKIMKWFADLKDLAFIAKDGASSTKYLRGDGTWQAFPTIPTVNNGKLTIQENGTQIAEFTANQSGNVTANIDTSTKVSKTGDTMTGKLNIESDGGSTIPLSLKGMSNAVYTGIEFKNNNNVVLGQLGIRNYTDIAEIRAVVNYNNTAHPLAYKSELDDKQATLVSGTNIKTINNTSLLGSGDISVQETLVSGTNIKTINNQSLLGSGNIVISQGGASWGNISGTLSNQTDLQNALDAKYTKGDDILIGQEGMGGGTKITSGHLTLYGSSTSGGGTLRLKTIELTAKTPLLTATELWTNPSPNASFSAQEIALSQALTNFDYYEIIYRVNTSQTRMMSTGLIPTDWRACLNYCAQRIYRRLTSEASDSSHINFGAGTYYATYGSDTTTNNNAVCIPYQVIGFKVL